MLMKINCGYCMLILLFVSCISNPPERKCTPEHIPTLESELRTTYTKEPDKALHQMQQLTYLYECTNAEPHKLGNTYLNMGTLYNEEKNDLDSSIIFLSKADSVFQSASDTLGWANISQISGIGRSQKRRFRWSSQNSAGQVII